MDAGGAGAMSAAGDLPLDQRPERPNASVEEKSGPGRCKLRYWYPAEERDVVTWNMEDTPTGNLRIRFEVKRQGTERVIYRHVSREVPASYNLRLNLVQMEQLPKVDKKKKCCRVKLEKKTDFCLLQFFRKESPVNVPPLS